MPAPLSNRFGTVTLGTDIQFNLDPSKTQVLKSGFVSVGSAEGVHHVEFRVNVGFKAANAAVLVSPAHWHETGSGTLAAFEISEYEVGQDGDEVVVRLKAGASNGVLRTIMYLMLAQGRGTSG